ncbi:DUF6596 domain-containing protein [Intrasporangium sp.]|uniref:DUF6596 domain-containing protein n=1 Tax=Intrasporangium sp. TaxID=1925024 RepID=UPI002939D1EA|nr:DUF6596 domain-containing protein [Intrasporangium sp.]MDV3220216.1 hypothetical protein [Intrasporangium sp.]
MLDSEFQDAWPRIVRALASHTGSLDDAEEYAAESLARAADQLRRPGSRIDSLAAWCIAVAKRAWTDERRRRAVEARLTPELVVPQVDPTSVPDMPDDPLVRGSDSLDDRLALLFVACDDALSATSQLVLALRVVCGLTTRQIASHLGIQETAAAARLTRAKRTLAEARGAFRVPDPAEQQRRLPVVLACVAGMFTVAHRTVLDPVDALADTGRQALSIADALVAAFPADPEVRGLRGVIRLGLARRPGRIDSAGTALALDEVDRRRWNRGLLARGLEDATFASARSSGRFALEAAISGLHSVAATYADTDWTRIITLYTALEQVWPSPSVVVARLAATAHLLIAEHESPARTEGLRHVEEELLRWEASPAAYASRDASLTLADLTWRTGRREEASARYRDLAEVMAAEPLRLFCLRRADS